MNRTRTLTGVLLAAGLALGATACGGDDGERDSAAAANTPAASQAPSAPATSAGTAATEPFGTACSAVPQDGAGSFSGILTYHVVGEKIAPDALAGGNFKTLQGAVLKSRGSGESFTVGAEAKVVCGNVQTANATVHIIDGVLMPPSS